MRPTFAFLPDAWDQPPETDDPPVECTECGRLDCACGGGDEWEDDSLPEEGV